jgi:ribosomal protein L11 methyltransferase
MFRSIPAAPAPSWRVALTVPAFAAPTVEEGLGDLFAATAAFEQGEEGGPWLVEAYAEAEPDRREIAVRVDLLARALGIDRPAVTIEALPPTDWLAATHAAFPPLDLGRFWVHGSHVEDRPPAGRVGIEIDAATAFGSGEHPTTRGCLAAIEQLAKRRPRLETAIDMGCGSGILAFAAAKTCARRVLAVDIEGESVRVARINAAANGVADRVTVGLSDGWRSRLVKQWLPVDLVLANILARPLAAMAKETAAALKPGGTVVLAGLLSRQEAQVLNAHRSRGLVLERRLQYGDWPTLVMRKPGWV